MVSSAPSQSVTGSPSSEGQTLSETRPQNACVIAIFDPSRHAIARFRPVQIVMAFAKV